MPNAAIIVQFVGKHPLTDVKITIMERTKVHDNGGQNFSVVHTVNLPVIKPIPAIPNYLGKWNLQGKEDHVFSVSIESRNITLKQAIYFKLDPENKWIMGTIIKRYIPLGDGAYRPELVFERLDPGFPSGGVIWPEI